MLFNSTQFLIFFPIVVLLYYVIPKKFRYIWLLISSYYFYMGWNPRYALLLLFSTAVTYVSGLLLGKANTIKIKNLIVAASFALNLSVLGFFKYTKMFVPDFDIILPVGISFYTFQALSYTMDVYRGEIYAEKNFFRYALFVSFFPQLVAGPIERSKNLLRQLAEPKSFDYDRARSGVFLMLWGYFLKVVLADRIAIFVDTAYGNIDQRGGWFLIIATILFAVQIYCDFYGYSVIAIGAAKILGIGLMENFKAPYLSGTVSEFWRRWHISLTSWFKDYLYIPLGGSRKGKLRKYINQMIVFLVSGLWHGADLSFVIWGGINGLYQVIGDILLPVRKKLAEIININVNSIGHRLLKMITTFVLVDFSWIFFRAKDMEQAIEVLKSIFTANNIWILFDGTIFKCGLDQKNFYLMIFAIALLLFADICKSKLIVINEVIAKEDVWVRWLVLVVAVCGILVYGIWGIGYNAANFIYFQF